MARELEHAVVALVASRQRASLELTPEWLVRPGRAECGSQWRRVKQIYRDLTGLELPITMRPVERRIVDAVLVVRGKEPRVLGSSATSQPGMS